VKWRYLPGYWLFRALSGIFGLLPEWAMRRVGYGLGRAASYIGGDRLRMAARHMERVTGAADGKPLARQVFRSYGRYWAETFWVRPRRLPEMLAHMTVEDVEIVRELRDRGGLILALPHLGNWEAAGLKAAEEKLRLVAAAELLPNPLISKWFIDQRNIFGIEVVLVRAGVTEHLRASLAAGKTLALLSDRNLSGRGVAVTFFGEETRLPAGPFVMAKRVGAPILPVATYFREKGRGHELVVRRPLQPGSIEEMAQELAGVFEELIAARPTQWHVLHPMWPSDRQ
jgi:KDO2-lipid IV(A) lauroyltransferase